MTLMKLISSEDNAINYPDVSHKGNNIIENYSYFCGKSQKKPQIISNGMSFPQCGNEDCSEVDISN